MNLSGRLLLSETTMQEFTTQASQLAQSEGVNLGVEITETVAARLSPVAVRQLHVLASAGCVLYLDDFGTGYSSIAHLRDLPVGTVKLDRSYAEAAMNPGSAYDVARGMAALTTTMQITSLVEGLENEAMIERLAQAGWQRGQGWRLGRPMPSEDFDAAWANDHGLRS